jgi:transposase, IS30 family
MSYTHLTRDERVMIAVYHQQQLSLRAIARKLHRHHSTISRELRRWRTAGGYDHQVADWQAEAKRRKPRHHYRSQYLPLLRYVFDALQQDWSPQQISARIKQDHPRQSRMRVSMETIYQWIYRLSSKGHALYQHLRRGRMERSPHSRSAFQKKYGLEPRHISDRPVGARHRSRYGHWEGDTVLGERGTGGLVTHVERKSRYLLAARIPDKTEPEVTGATCRLYRRLDTALKRTLTLDQGKEFSGFRRIEAKTGLSLYFCDPSSPWQRGTNENTNGLLRQYFPKGMDMQLIKQSDLDEAVRRINNRPRKCLGYKTPTEVLQKTKHGALGI